MGYNPLRRYRGGKAVDITMLVLFTALVIGLVIWATG